MTTSARPRRVPRRNLALEKAVLTALDDMKAVNVKLLDVRGLTDIADAMVIACGNSDRHVKAIADRIVHNARELGRRPLGVEGVRESEWILVDLQDVLVHVMLPRVREFYAIEQLWEPPPADSPEAGGARKAAARGSRSGARRSTAGRKPRRTASRAAAP